MPYAPWAHPESELREWVSSVLVPSGGVTVAEVLDQVAGVMVTARSEEVSWINQMAVDPRLVNQGIGALLLVHAMSTLALPICLYTFQANAGARRFYERHGFVPTEFTDGEANEERCPDVLYKLQGIQAEA